MLPFLEEVLVQNMSMVVQVGLTRMEMYIRQYVLDVGGIQIFLQQLAHGLLQTIVQIVILVLLNSLNEPIISGGTASTDLFTSPSAIHANSNGLQDGFVAKYNNTGSNVTSASYIGTSGYDQCYFVQVDLNDNIYLFGQTEGTYPIFPANIYNNPGSGQFLHKLSPDMSTTLFSTVFGSGSGINIAPSAFLVTDCAVSYTHLTLPTTPYV